MLEQEAVEGVDPLVGRILLGRYRITKLLGEGGMGKVYLAEQKMGTATRSVAIKTLHSELNSDPQLVARFHRECETVIDLHHPNTVQFYDFGELEDKTLFIVMEYIQGEDLAHTLQRGAIEPDRADRLLIQICGSLFEAHNMGVVHRDLKPENVLLTQRGGQTDFVKVLDFGIAKRNEAEDESQAKLTKQGMVLGTPPYMSPEQFSGQSLDARSDIYSLGVMTYEILTGHLPFEARTPWEWATKHLTAPPTPIETYPGGASLPPRKKAAIMRALAKNRDDRHATVMEFLNDFTGIQDAQAAWTMATSAGIAAGTSASNPPMNTAPQMPVSRPSVGTPQPMHSQPGNQPLYPSQPGTHASSGPGSIGYDPTQTGGLYQTGPQPAQGGGMGRWLAIAAALVVFVGGAGAVILVWVLSQTSDPTAVAQPQPVAPPPGAQVAVPTATPQPPAVPPQPPTQVQSPTPTATPPAEVPTATPPPTTVEATPTPEPAEEPEEPETTSGRSSGRSSSSGSSGGDRAAGQAALASARAAVGQNDVERAISALRTAQRALGSSDSDVASVRSQLAQRGGTKVGILIQMGRCDQARALYRQLRGVNAAGSARQHFGDWCRP
ncbi:MAG: protein kinase [Polyangiales bacterium]